MTEPAEVANEVAVCTARTHWTGVALVPGRTEWDGARSHQAAQHGTQLKTYKLFISGVFSLIFLYGG